MPASVIDLIPPGVASFEQNVFPQLAEERRLGCEVVNREFYEIGTPEELARARAALA